MSHNAEDNGLLIRNCNEEDLTQIIDLERRCFRFPYDRRTFIRFLSSPTSMFLVCEASKKVVGYIICDARGKEAGVIVSIAVSPERRGKGVGSKLLSTALSMLKERVSVAELQVAKSNKVAIDFYRAHGFEIRGVIPRYYPDGEDAYSMSRPLRA